MSEPARPAEFGSHRAEALTDVIVHTGETRETIDPIQGRHDEHRQSGDELREAIDAVAESHLGADRDVVGAALSAISRRAIAGPSPSGGSTRWPPTSRRGRSTRSAERGCWLVRCARTGP